jgi:uncharacterized protein (TIGR02246 family)
MARDDEAIRKVIDAWLVANEAGDLDAALGLLADDVVFLVAGQASFGKAQFAATFRAMVEQGLRVRARCELRELVVAGEWAWCRSDLQVAVSPPGGAPARRAGPALTVFRKQRDGAWVIARDANLVVPSADPGEADR